jgi:hypothetical protein
MLLLKSSNILLSSKNTITFVLLFRLNMSKTIFMAAVLAAATMLAAGLILLPGSVQEAQANPCPVNEVNQNPETDDSEEIDSGIESEFYGPVDIEE